MARHPVGVQDPFTGPHNLTEKVPPVGAGSKVKRNGQATRQAIAIARAGPPIRSGSLGLLTTSQAVIGRFP